MRTEPLDLAHQSILQPLLRSIEVALSEYTFANLYLFRKVHRYEVLFAKEVCIRGVSYDGGRFLMPTSLASLQMIVNDKTQFSDIDFLFPIPEEWLQIATGCNFSFKDEDSDYIYDAHKISTYSGLSKKRNLVHQFLEHNAPSQGTIDKEQALQALSAWQTGVEEELDYTSCKEAIDLFEQLELEGMLFRVGAKPIGFIIGEPLTNDTFVIHFAKADRAYKGIYQYMYQQFALQMEGRFQFLNVEQDLASPELRHSKHSYHPISLRKKFRITFR